MTWVLLGSSTATYSTPATYSRTWVPARAEQPSPPAWGLFDSRVTTVDEGVDFVLRMSDQFPIFMSDDRPVLMRDLQDEGRP